MPCTTDPAEDDLPVGEMTGLSIPHLCTLQNRQELSSPQRVVPASAMHVNTGPGALNSNIGSGPQYVNNSSGTFVNLTQIHYGENTFVIS